MAIVRNYADPRAIPSAGAVGSSAATPLAMAAPDVAGLQFTYADNPALNGGINSAFQDLLGREATPEEIAKYNSDSKAPFASVVQNIVKDNFDSISDDTVIKYLDKGASNEFDAHNWNPTRASLIQQAGLDDAARAQDSSGIDANLSAHTNLASSYVGKRFANYLGESGGGNTEIPYFRNSNDVAQFLTKMDKAQTAALFKDTGLDDSQANGLANYIANQDWTGVNENDMQAKLGMSDAQLGALGRAMFSNRDAVAQMASYTDDGRLGKTSDTNIYARPHDSDHNNQDYKQFTVYDPKKGLHFTGGYIPEPKKTDWMGNIILGVLVAMTGGAAGALIGGAAAAAGAGGAAASVGTAAAAGTVGAATGVAAGTGMAGTIGAIGGGMVAGGTSAAMQGTSIGRGMLTGGVTGGLGQIAAPVMTGSRVVDGAITGAARGAIGAKVAGGDVTVGAISGATGSVINPIVQRYVPGIAGNLVSGYVNSAVKASLIDTPTRTRAPAAASQVQTGMISALPTLTTNRRVVRG